MAKQPSISNATAIAACDTIAAMVDEPGGDQGKLRIYSGTQPPDTDTPVSGQTLLVEFTLPWPAFQGATDTTPGATALTNPIPDAIAIASGTATWFRVVTKSGIARFDGNAGIADEDCILSTNIIQAGQTVQCFFIKYKVRETPSP